MGFLGSSAGKESACNSGDHILIPGLGRYPWRKNRQPTPVFLGFPGGSGSKEYACNSEDLGSIPGVGRSPGEGKGYPLPVFLPREFHGLYSPWGRKELDTTETLSLSPCGCTYFSCVFNQSIRFCFLWMCQHSILRILTLAVYVAIELTFKRLKLKGNYQARQYFN